MNRYLNSTKKGPRQGTFSNKYKPSRIGEPVITPVAAPTKDTAPTMAPSTDEGADIPIDYNEDKVEATAPVEAKEEATTGDAEVKADEAPEEAEATNVCTDCDTTFKTARGLAVHTTTKHSE